MLDTLAHVGLEPAEAKRRGIKIDASTQRLDRVDRAILKEADVGFYLVHVKNGTNIIVGATIIATNAGDMINAITLAMVHGLGLKKIASTIYPYPTQGDATRKVEDLYNRNRLMPFVQKRFRK